MIRQIKLSLSTDEVIQLYNGASQVRKLELEELCPELKPTSIIDRVQTYKDALEVLRRKHFNENNLYPREIARRRLEIIVEALNEGWKPDFNNIKQSKWCCWAYGSHTGIGFSISLLSPMYGDTSVGVRLCLKSKKLADYIGNQFKYLYEEMLLG